MTEVFDIPVRLDILVRILQILTSCTQATTVDIITGSMANGLCSAGGFCAGSLDVIAHQRINSPAFVFSAALPPLLAVSASESISLLSIPLSSTSPSHPLSVLPSLVSTLRTILDSVPTIEIPSASASPLIHVQIKPSALSGVKTVAATGGLGISALPVPESSREEQERLLQDVVDYCAENGVLVTKTKRNWEQEMVEHRPSIRICVTAGLNKKEIEKAGGVLKAGLVKELGKGKK